MSGILLGKFEDFFKNSRLCTSPGPIFPTVIVLLTAVPRLVTQRSSRKEFWEKRCVRRAVLRLATQHFPPKDPWEEVLRDETKNGSVEDFTRHAKNGASRAFL